MVISLFLTVDSSVRNSYFSNLFRAVLTFCIVTPAPDEYIECTLCGHTEHRPDPDVISAKNHAEDQIARDAMATGTSGTVKFKP